MNDKKKPDDQTPEKPEGTLRPGSFKPESGSTPTDDRPVESSPHSDGTIRPGAPTGPASGDQAFIPATDEFSLSDEFEIPEIPAIGTSSVDDGEDDVSRTISSKNLDEDVQLALTRIVDSLSESEHEALSKIDGSTVDLRQVLNVQNHVIKGQLSGIIAYAGEDPEADDTARSLRVWSVASGKEVLSLKDLPDDMTVTFSPDSQRVAVAGQGTSVQIFDAVSGNVQQTLSGHDAKVLCLTFSPDGKYLATGSRDLTARVWDVKSGQQHMTLEGHTAEILHLAYNTDGTTLASSSRDTTVKLWNTADGKNVTTLEGHSDDVYGVQFSPDGSRILSWAQVDPRPELEILGEIGRGAMGVVYDAQQTSLNRKLAIKTLKPGTGTTTDNASGSERASSFQEDRKLRDMFISEAVITANLVHPNIVPVHNLGQTEDSKLFYSMKLVEGDSWKKVIGTNSLDDNLEILMKMADGVAFAHNKGVINRDLKPENVHVGGFGEVMVLDWGLAITTNEFRQKNSVRTHSDSFGGSPPYMAPEQAIQGQVHRIGYHTDIYLLGAILFQIITGRAPHHFVEFDGLPRNEAIGEILAAAFNNDIINAAEHKGELLDIAEKAMSTEPENRYATVEHFQAALHEYQTIGRADELLQNALTSKGDTGYGDYQKAVALYSEATRSGDNKRAKDGLERANLAYASLAHQNKDFDLGLQVIEKSDGPEHVVVRKKLKKGQTRRKLLTATTLTALGLAVTGLVGSWVLYGRADTAIAKATEAQEQVKEADSKIAQADKKLGEAQQKIADADTTLKDNLSKQQAILDGQKKVALTELQQTLEKSKETALKAQQETLEETKANELMAQKAELERLKKAELTKQEMVLADLFDDEKKKQEKTLTENFQKEEKRLGDILETTQLRGLTSELSASLREGAYESARATIEKLKALKSVQEDKEQLNEFIGLERKLKTSTSTPSEAAFVTPGLVVVAHAADDKTSVEAWGIKDGELQQKITLPVTDSARPSHVCTTKDGTTVALFDQEKLHLIDKANNETRSVAFPRCSVAKFDESGDNLICGSSAGLIQIFDTKTLKSKLGKGLKIDPRADYKVADLLWDTAEDSPSILVILRKGQQTLCGSFPLSKTTDGYNVDKFRQLEFPKDYRPALSKLSMNQDGSLLALNDLDNANLIILTRQQSNETKFPFRSPLDLGNESAWKFDLAEVVGRHPEVNKSSGRAQDIVTHLAFGDTTNQLVTSCDDSTVRVWNFNGGSLSAAFIQAKEENKLVGHADAITTCAFAGDSDTQIITTSLDGTVRLWDISDNGRSYQELRKEILKVSEDANKKADDLREASKRQRRVSLVQPALRLMLGSIAWLSQPPLVAPNKATASGEDSRIDGNGKKKETPAPATGNVSADARFIGPTSAVAFHPNGDTFISAGHDRRASIWATDGWDGSKKQSPRQDFTEGHRFSLNEMTFSSDGDYLFTTSYDGSLIVWDAKDDANGIGRQLGRVNQLGLSNAFAVSPDGRTIVTSSFASDGENTKFGAKVWQRDALLSTTSPMPQYELYDAHQARVTAIAFSPDGESVATADREGTIVIWKDGTKTASFAKFEDGVSTIKFIDANRILAASFDEGQLVLIDVSGTATAPTISTYETGESDFVWKLDVSPDGKQFVASTIKTVNDEDDEPVTVTLNVQVWDVEDTEPAASLGKPRVFKAKRGGTADTYRHGISWTEDAQQVAFVINGEVQLYDASNWKRTVRLRDPSAQKAVLPVAGAFQPNQDEKTLATYDGRTVRLWKFQSKGSRTEAVHAASFRSSARVVAVDFSSDGKYVITGSRVLRIYDAESREPVLRIERTTNTDKGNAAQTRKSDYLHSGVLTWAEFTPEQGSDDFLSSGLDENLRIWDWTPGSNEEPDCVVLKHDAGSIVRQAHWGPSGRQVVSVTDNGKAMLWNVDTGKPTVLDLPKNQKFDFRCCAFSSGTGNSAQQWVAAGGTSQTNQSSSSTAVIWKLVNGQPSLHSVVNASEHGNQGITAATFTGEDRIITGGTRGSLIKWEFKSLNAPDGKLRNARLLFPLVDFRQSNRRRTAHRGAVTSLTTASDGTIASSGEDTVHIWN